MGILEELANAPQEGQETNPGTEKETPASPPEAENTKDTENPAPEGEHTQPERDLPFHENPKVQDYLKRQIDNKAKEIEEKHQQEIQKIRDEFTSKKTEKSEPTEVPEWFGGDETAWSKFDAFLSTKTEAAEQRAIEKYKNSVAEGNRLMQQATEYMNAEVAAIESDKELNPDGLKVDVNRLGAIVDKFDLRDKKDNNVWNWRGAWEIYKMQIPKGEKIDLSEKKKLIAASSSSNRAEEKPVPYKTHEDFKNGAPW